MRHTLVTALLMGAVFTILGCGCSAPYLLDTSYHHLRLLSQRVPITTILADEAAPPRLRAELQQVESIRRFARDELDMAVKGSYSTYVEVEGPYVTYNLSACPPDRFEAYQWRFPVVGAVPYKGFFHLQSAREEERRLAAAGYETYLRGVRAYSTLGWFGDPVLSTMLNKDRYWLADLLFHELTHATLFIRDQVAFNESLATFVAKHATLSYIARTEGAHSDAYREMVASYEESHRFNSLVHDLYLALDGLYSDPSADLETRRQELFVDFRLHLLSPESGVTSPGYLRFAEGSLNNAKLLAYHRYHDGQDLLAALLSHHHGDIGAMLAALKSRRRELRRDPFERLRQWNMARAQSPP